ncbi:MAG: hypothetical protein V4760_11590 [Bdellovibrionota bacterium]
MKFQLQVQPLPFPQALNDMGNLKLVLGLALFLVGVLVFSMWKEKFFALKEDERVKFLMFNVAGGGWILAVFAVCGGMYFLFDSIFKFTT